MEARRQSEPQTAQHNPAAGYENNFAQLQVRIDPELGRLTVVLNLAAQHRLWSVARTLHGTPGYVQRETLYSTLEALHIDHNRRYLDQLIRTGDGIFWGISRDRHTLYLRSPMRVTTQLIKQLEQRKQQAVYETNLPGARPVVVPVLPHKSVAAWEATIYAAWMAWRRDPTIARSTLSTLFDRSPDTLRNWEKQHLVDLVKVRTTRAQVLTSALPDSYTLPEHAVHITTRWGDTGYQFQLPNKYVSTLRQHTHKGQAAKVYRAALAAAGFVQPVDDRGALHPIKHGSDSEPRDDRRGFDRPHSTPRRYHHAPHRFARLLKRVRRDDGFRQREHFVYAGVDRNDSIIYELVTPDETGRITQTRWQPITQAGDRLQPAQEYSLDKKTRRNYKAIERRRWRAQRKYKSVQGTYTS